MNNNNAFGGIKFESDDINYEAAEAAVANLGSLMGGHAQQGECVSCHLIFMCLSYVLRYIDIIIISWGTVLYSLFHFSTLV